jgi:glucosamine--fructose-6-phosphate aminotransferase (isomerizing)
MCGIFGYIGDKNNAFNIVYNGLLSLEYRGYDSWGIAFLKKVDKVEKKIGVEKNVGRLNKRINYHINTNFALGHTRWATHGGVTKVNAHPHLDCNNNFAIIHNGIIENYQELKTNLIKKGHKFISETDTEVAVHLIEDIYKNLNNKVFNEKEKFKKAVIESFKRLQGMNAIIVMDNISKSFMAAKNGSPLVIGRGKKENFLASDAHALLPHTKTVYYMEDMEYVMFDKINIEIFDMHARVKKNIKFQTLDWKETQVSKGSYPHFMIKEIFEQPEVISNINKTSESEIQILADIIKKSYGTYFIGCGTASYACLAGTYLFSKIAKRHVNFAVGSEFGYLLDFLTEKSFVIALSQSGETIDVIEAVKKAKEKGAKLASLVNVIGSTLYRLSDKKLLLMAGPEKAVVSTKAFTAKLAYLLLLSYELTGNIAQGRKLLEKSVLSMKRILHKSATDKIKNLAKLIKDKDHIYCIGRGLSYPIALESALKIKEASYIHAEGFAAGELKHGVIALIEKDTPSLVFLPNDETYDATLAGAIEMKARGSFVIGISFKNHPIFDYYLPFDDCSNASILPEIIIGQLLGYYLAIYRGSDPDMPRNLAKSVTVK